MSKATRCPRILVTRPEPGASSTATILSERGFEPMKLPLTRVLPVEVGDKQALRFSRASCVIVTSANAVRHAPSEIVDRMRNVPIIAVGAATADQARQRGLKAIESVDADAKAVIDHVSNRVAPGSTVGYLCGRLRRDTVETGLSEQQLSVIIAETYETQKVSYMTDNLVRMYEASPFDGATVFSGVSAALLAKQADQSSLHQHFENKPVFVISQRAADVLNTKWPGPILVSKKMNAESIHSLVVTHFFGTTS